MPYIVYVLFEKWMGIEGKLLKCWNLHTESIEYEKKNLNTCILEKYNTQKLKLRYLYYFACIFKSPSVS